MCNPRRIRITAIRSLNSRWQTEVNRIVELQQDVTGEARVRQSLGNSLGAPALRALEHLLAQPGSGWVEVPEGYRHDVEGGYVLYLTADRAIEIVAVAMDQVSGTGEARIAVDVEVNKELSAEGEGVYYSDNWGDRTEAVAQKEAREQAEQNLDALANLELRQATERAVAGVAADVQSAAEARARASLDAQAAKRSAELAARAREHLDAVGLRARQAFNGMLASAYRDAILAYARQNGADNFHLNETNNAVEIEFTFTG